MKNQLQGFLGAWVLFCLVACNTGDGYCGDGLVQAGSGETCEAAHLMDQTCQEHGRYPGTLSCDDACRLDFSGCGGYCGDNRTQAAFGEVCDAGDLAGQTCVTLGYLGGGLACRPDCSGFDATGCRLLGMIEVPGGTFQRDEDPANLTTVSGFLMSRTEITRAQYRIVTGHDPTDEAYSSGPGDPVWNVTLSEALAFCNALSRFEGLAPVYPHSGSTFGADLSADGYRLPTEMEWRWAAMGADLEASGEVNTTGWARAFPGDDGSLLLEDFAVFGYGTGEPGATRNNRTENVCSRLPNELGFCDLSGNIMEWTMDRFAPIPTGHLTDYVPADNTGYEFALTGGSWCSSAERCTLAFRRSAEPDFGLLTYYGVGFRVVRRPR